MGNRKTKKINKDKILYFERLLKLIIPSKSDQNISQINNIRNERKILFTDSTDIKSTMIKHYIEFNVKIFDNLDEIDKSFKRHKLPTGTRRNRTYIFLYIVKKINS